MMTLRFPTKELQQAVEKGVQKAAQGRILDALAEEAIKIIQDRTSQEGVTVQGRRFKRYSTDPIYISRKHRPSPKGGIDPSSQSEPKDMLQALKDLPEYNATPNTAKLKTKKKKKSPHAGKSHTVFYPGGYEEYKGSSIGRSDVTLYGTFKMLKSLRYRKRAKSRVLYFPMPYNDIAHGHNTGDGTAPKREFFGVDGRAVDRARMQKVWEVMARGNV